jgi:hypothetical protein
MLLSTDPKFLFIHIPKCGGTSVEESLYHYQDFKYHHMVHGCALQFKQYMNDNFYDELFKFSFIRNPWDLQVSCWRYYVRNHGVDMDFNEYIEWKFTGSIEDMKYRLPKEDPNVNITLLTNGFYIHRSPITYFLIDEQGNYLIDYIGSLERINEHFSAITEKLDIQDTYLPHLNISLEQIDDHDYKSYYNEKSIELVRSRFSLDIFLYGYTFENKFADTKKIGEINQTNNSIQKRGYKLPIDFYFSIGDLPYGFGEIEYRYDKSHLDKEFNNFQINKSERRVVSLQKNIKSIEDNIYRMENLILDDPENYLIFNTYGKDIEKLRSKILIYKKEIGKIENLINSLQIEGHTQDENY